jgi:hypothetical protein
MLAIDCIHSCYTISDCYNVYLVLKEFLTKKMYKRMYSKQEHGMPFAYWAACLHIDHEGGSV